MQIRNMLAILYVCPFKQDRTKFHDLHKSCSNKITDNAKVPRIAKKLKQKI